MKNWRDDEKLEGRWKIAGMIENSRDDGKLRDDGNWRDDGKLEG